MSDPVEVKTIDLILENRQLIAENTELRKRVAELEKEIAVLNHEICPNGCGELTTIGTVPLFTKLGVQGVRLCCRMLRRTNMTVDERAVEITVNILTPILSSISPLEYITLRDRIVRTIINAEEFGRKEGESQSLGQARGIIEGLHKEANSLRVEILVLRKIINHITERMVSCAQSLINHAASARHDITKAANEKLPSAAEVHTRPGQALNDDSRHA
jgi:hypothetical protein